MTRHDFYKLAIESLLPPDTPDYWADYRTGAITHFEALRRYFAAIRSGREEVLAVVEQPPSQLESRLQLPAPQEGECRDDSDSSFPKNP